MFAGVKKPLLNGSAISGPSARAGDGAHGPLEVVWENGRLVVNSANANQAGAIFSGSGNAPSSAGWMAHQPEGAGAGYRRGAY
jgi:hypothetical protein